MTVKLLAATVAVVLAGVAVRALVTRGNTQVHRINQHKPAVTDRRK